MSVSRRPLAIACETAVDDVQARAYRIATDMPEADGTFAWNSTTLVLVEVTGAGKSGIGYTYADAAVAELINQTLKEEVCGLDCFDISAAWLAMQRHVRNIGRPGMAACGISAIDTALWDLKAKLLGLPLAKLIGRCRSEVPVYGSGGFTTYSDDQLIAQLASWVESDGCRAVKMKVGSNPADDPRRIKVAHSAIRDRDLFIDANGAFSPRQAIELMHLSAKANVAWFEEPVSSDDLAGLRFVRDRLSPETDLAAGEYIYTLDDARRLLEAGAIDVLQADATRCLGITGFLGIAALCNAHHVALSAHCAPALHRHVACCVAPLRHIEWFHDHVRIERLLFDGAPIAQDGMIAPDWSRPGHGIEFKRQDAAPYEL